MTFVCCGTLETDWMVVVSVYVRHYHQSYSVAYGWPVSAYVGVYVCVCDG